MAQGMHARDLGTTEGVLYGLSHCISSRTHTHHTGDLASLLMLEGRALARTNQNEKPPSAHWVR